MEINPFDARMRMLDQRDGVQLLRTATPRDDTAGCPGCPYFWSCDVPHKTNDIVEAPEDIDVADAEAAGIIAPRSTYRPRDESDIGWTDQWIEEETDEDSPHPHASEPRLRGTR